MRTLIENGRVIDPANNIDAVQSICIEDKNIVAIGNIPSNFKAEQTINASGQVVCPGLVDIRVRLREPGYKEKGSIATETLAAVSGGVTTVCCPPDTSPIIDSPSVVEWIHRRAQESGIAKVHVMGALMQGLSSNQISNMWALKQAGCVGMSHGHKPVKTEIMRRAMEYAASHDLTVYLHAEEPTLNNDGVAHEGIMSVRLGLAGIPEIAETVAIGRDLQLIELTGVKAHFCHLSSQKAVKMIARAQYDGLPITADVTSYHLFLTEMDIGNFNSQCHVRPPLRTQRDREGLRAGLKSNTLSVISSDHQPHDVDAKLAPFPSSEPGISGIETLLPLTLRLVDENVIGLSEAIAKLTCNPASVLGINAGTLSIGQAADICVFDPNQHWQFKIDTMQSAGKNSPFIDWEFKGQVTHTLVDGSLVFQMDDQ